MPLKHKRQPSARIIKLLDESNRVATTFIEGQKTMTTQHPVAFFAESLATAITLAVLLGTFYLCLHG
jgi:hypothetical protein